METKELRTKTSAELLKMVEEKKSSISNFKFGIAGSKIKNVKESKNLRKEVAQILTVLKEKK